MKGTKSDLHERNTSIQRLLTHTEEVSEQRGKIEVIVVLKSSFFIALYNNIEATMYSSLESLHYHISLQKSCDITEELQKRIIDYLLGRGNQEQLKDKEKISKIKKDILDNDIRFPNIDEFIKRKSIFSGNLDTRKIKSILLEYGIHKEKFGANEEHLLIIKNKRNKISHGELSLSDAGKGIKNKELNEIFKSSKIVLEETIDSISEFINDQRYLKINK